MKPLDRGPGWWAENWTNISAENLWPSYSDVKLWVDRNGMTDDIIALMDMMMKEKYYPLYQVIDTDRFDSIQATWHVIFLLSRPVPIEQKYQRVGYLITIWSDPIKLQHLFLTIGHELAQYKKEKLKFVPPHIPPDVDGNLMDKEERAQWIPDDLLSLAWEFGARRDPIYDVVLDACENSGRFLMYPHTKPGIDRNKATKYITFVANSTLNDQIVNDLMTYLLHIWYDEVELKRIADIYSEAKEIIFH